MAHSPAASAHALGGRFVGSSFEVSHEAPATRSPIRHHRRLTGSSKASPQATIMLAAAYTPSTVSSRVNNEVPVRPESGNGDMRIDGPLCQDKPQLEPAGKEAKPDGPQEQSDCAWEQAVNNILNWKIWNLLSAHLRRIIFDNCIHDIYRLFTGCPLPD